MLLSRISQFLPYPVVFPERAYFFLKFERAIICREALVRISFEFLGHLASLGTRKYTKVASAQYNLFES
jgi:hypothetical protein